MTDAECLLQLAKIDRTFLCGGYADRLEAIANKLKRMEEALRGLVQAVELDTHVNNGISGYTGARLSDARAALKD